MQLIFKGSQLFLQPNGEDQIRRIVRPDIQGHDQVIPYPKKLENAEGRQSRNGQWHDDPRENLQMAGTVNPCALQKLFGQADDVIAQQINGQRQAKGRVSDPKAGKGLGRHLAAVRQFTIGQPLV